MEHLSVYFTMHFYNQYYSNICNNAFDINVPCLLFALGKILNHIYMVLLLYLCCCLVAVVFVLFCFACSFIWNKEVLGLT